MPRFSVGSAFRIDTLDSHDSPQSVKALNASSLGKGTSREALHNSKDSKDNGSEINSPATIPTDEDYDDGQQSWQGARSETRKLSKFTENEEIYKNVRKFFE